MNQSKMVIKKLNQLLNSEDLTISSRAKLLEIKKAVEYGEVKFTNGLNNTMLMSFYKDYVEDIAIWLNEPVGVVMKKIKENELTEVENKLILTNILIKVKESKELDDESLY